MAFVSPAEGRVTSHWGPRERHPVTGARGFHRGIDIAPPIPGQRGCPVYAAYGGTVVYVSEGVYNKRRRRWEYNEDITGGWNSGSLVVIAGDGGGNEAYGHMSGIRVKVGQRVQAGDRLGTMDQIGNVTGIHLHFECWNGRTTGGGAKGGNTRDPRLDFKRHGVAPGSAPVLPKTPVAPLPERTWFDMATKNDLRDVIEEKVAPIIRRLDDLDAELTKVKIATGRIDLGADTSHREQVNIVKTALGRIDPGLGKDLLTEIERLITHHCGTDETETDNA